MLAVTPAIPRMCHHAESGNQLCQEESMYIHQQFGAQGEKNLHVCRCQSSWYGIFVNARGLLFLLTSSTKEKFIFSIISFRASQLADQNCQSN